GLLQERLRRRGKPDRPLVPTDPGHGLGQLGDGVVRLQHRTVPSGAARDEPKPGHALLRGLDQVEAAPADRCAEPPDLAPRPPTPARAHVHTPPPPPPPPPPPARATTASRSPAGGRPPPPTPRRRPARLLAPLPFMPPPPPPQVRPAFPPRKNGSPRQSAAS